MRAPDLDAMLPPALARHVAEHGAMKPRRALVPLSARRLRILEAIAEQLGQAKGRPLTPAAALGLVVEWAPRALGALERERAREADRPKVAAYRPDPDAWPMEGTSAAARLAYREGVRRLLGFDRDGNPFGPWRCPGCRRFYNVGAVRCDEAKRTTGRRWWECPACPTSEGLRRRVRAFRQAWDWPAAERAAEARQVAEANARTRAALLEARYAIAGSRELEARVGKVAGLERDDEARTEQHGFRCRACGSTWRPFAPLRRTLSGEPAPLAGDLRAPLAWWACPKGCNARAAAKVARLAGSPLERRWLEPVDAEGAAVLRGAILGRVRA